MYPGWDRTAAEQDWIAKGRPTGGTSGGGQSLSDYMRGQIESGYNDYFSKLNDLYGGLDTQANGRNNHTKQKEYCHLHCIANTLFFCNVP